MSPDSSVVATPDQDFVTSIVHLPAGGSTRLAPCESVRAFDQHGRVAAVDAFLVCDERGQVPSGASRITDLQSDNTLLDLTGSKIYVAGFGPPGDDGLPRIAVVEDGDSGVVTTYDLVTGTAIGTYAPDADRVTSLAVSPGGERLAMLLDSGRLVVLDTSRIRQGDDQTDATVFDIVAHAAGSKAVAFSSSGMIATGSSADGLKVWSPDGKLVASVPTHQDDDPTFAFAPGTDTLYYEDGQGIVRAIRRGHGRRRTPRPLGPHPRLHPTGMRPILPRRAVPQIQHLRDVHAHPCAPRLEQPLSALGLWDGFRPTSGGTRGQSQRSHPRRRIEGTS